MTDLTPLLSVDDVHVDYEGIISALRGVSLDVRRGEIVALLGSNGAGKTTTLKAASGLLEAERGAITRGSIRFADLPRRLDPRGLARAGLVQVLEGRRCFSHLSVHENLLSGTLVRRLRRGEAEADLEQVYALFPRLKERVASSAGFLSGGEQQMLAIGRALMLRPRLLLLDEPSIGLAPQIVREIFDAISRLNREGGLSVLIAEQNARAALRIAHRAVVLENGRVVLSGSADELSSREDIKNFYLGHGASEQGRLEALKATLRAERAST
ncbi:MAG TPA: ABC transporter ATP-binding protein [Polyangiaceae bacterium]|nr:ABC transporter ATP-binding protein [Polyangiaceae bacterium]